MRGLASSADSAVPLPKARKSLLYWTLVSVGGFAVLLVVAVLVVLMLLRQYMTDKDLTWDDLSKNPEKVIALTTPLPGKDGATQDPLIFQGGQLHPNGDPAAQAALDRLFPDWVPAYPGTTPRSSAANFTGNQHLVSFQFETQDRPEQILEFYRQELSNSGLTIFEDRTDLHNAFLRAGADDGRSVVLVAPHEGSASLTIDDPSFARE